MVLKKHHQPPAGFFRARKYWPGQESEYKETFTALLQQGVSATEAQQQASLKARAPIGRRKKRHSCLATSER